MTDRHTIDMAPATRRDPDANAAEDTLARFAATINHHLLMVRPLPDGHQVEAWWWEGITDEERDWVMPVYFGVRPDLDDYEDGVLDLGSGTFREQVRYALHQLTGDPGYEDPETSDHNRAAREVGRILGAHGVILPPKEWSGLVVELVELVRGGDAR